MLTDEQRAEGWIEWHGGECPVPLDSRPGVITRVGRKISQGFVRARKWEWERGGCLPSADIIAYKPEVPND